MHSYISYDAVFYVILRIYVFLRMHSYISYDAVFYVFLRIYGFLRMHSYINYDAVFLCHPAKKRVTSKEGQVVIQVVFAVLFCECICSECIYRHVCIRDVNVCRLYKYVLLYINSTHVFSHTHTGCMSPLQICSPLQKCSPIRQIYTYVSSHTHARCSKVRLHYKYVLAYVYSTKMFSRTSALCMCVHTHIHVRTCMARTAAIERHMYVYTHTHTKAQTFGKTFYVCEYVFRMYVPCF